jgi:hypothetical protein
MGAETDPRGTFFDADYDAQPAWNGYDTGIVDSRNGNIGIAGKV